MERVLKVLHLISSSGMYGAENVVLQLAHALRRRTDCHPIIGVIENHDTPHRELAEEGAAQGIDAVVFPCRGKYDLRTAFRLRRFLEEERVLVLHSHGYKANSVARTAAVAWKGGLVATCHNWPGRSLRMRAYAALDKVLLQGFDRVVAVSDEVLGKIPGSHAREPWARVIKNGIDVHSFPGAHRARAGDDSSGARPYGPVVGYVGRLSDEKGVRVFLEGAELVRERFPRAHFLLVGDGPLRREYETRFASPHLHFSGFRKPVHRCYRCMDVFVLPSFGEGLPMALLEAMASGLPVVATKVGQVPEVVEQGQTGHLVEPGDRGGLAEAICRLIEDPGRAALMGRRGYERVAAGYSADLMAERYWGVYQEALQ